MVKLTRREFLAGGAAVLAAGTAPVRAATSRFDGTIRVANLGIDLIEPIRQRAEKDLRLRILSEANYGGPTELRWVRQQPGAFDVFAGWQGQIDPLWPAGNLQPIEIARIERWRKISPLLKLGKLRPGDPRCTYGQGDAAFRKLYLDPERSGRWKSTPDTPRELQGLIVEWVDETTGKPVGAEPGFCTGVPHAFAFDSFGYNTHVIRKRPDQLSWAELLNPRWRRRVALPNDPIGFMDAGNAARAAGLLKVRDLGDPTRREIDALVKLLLAMQRKRHFYGLWGDAVGWMRSGQVVIESMFAPQVESLAAIGFPVRSAAPREGYRAFALMLSISTEVIDSAKLKACYDFINWWHSGFAGSVLLRQGWYNPVQETSRRFVTPGEWAYWVEGKPADRNYPGPFGDVSVRKNQTRDGGSFARRACRIASWNSWGRNEAHLLERWYEFASTFS